MNRRSFLKAFTGAVVGAGVVAAQPEWMLSIIGDKGVVAGPVPLSQVKAVSFRTIQPQIITDNFFRDSPFVTYLKAQGDFKEIPWPANL